MRINLKALVLVGLVSIIGHAASADLCRMGAEQVNSEPTLKAALNGVDVFTTWEDKINKAVVTVQPAGGAILQVEVKGEVAKIPIPDVLICLDLKTKKAYVLANSVRIDISDDFKSASGIFPMSGTKVILTRASK